MYILKKNANLNQYVYDKESMPSSCACSMLQHKNHQLLPKQTRADYLH